jgi:isocitrate/isopropylmalate dehydrogenase
MLDCGRTLDLYANLRPVRALPNVPCRYPELDLVSCERTLRVCMRVWNTSSCRVSLRV